MTRGGLVRKLVYLVAAAAFLGLFCQPQRAVAHWPPTPNCEGLQATIVGSDGDDVITGTPGDDVIAGLEGNDWIEGGGGNDVICGDRGDDTLEGGACDNAGHKGRRGQGA